MRRSEKITTVIDRLDKSMGAVDTELHYDSPFHLLVAVVLSALYNQRLKAANAMDFASATQATLSPFCL